MNKITVYVEKFGNALGTVYRIVRVKNALEPSVGSDITAEQIEGLIARGIEVIVDTPRPRERR